LETVTVATRVTLEFRKRMQDVMSSHGYINEADFIREAIRSHIYALQQHNKDEEKKVS